MPISKIKTGSITDSAITSDKIQDGSIVDADISSSTTIAGSKLDVDTSALDQNIALLGFKMAVNEGLTVFNLVDGVVDEFNDETGTDGSEGSNQNYDLVNDLYNNFATKPISAGFADSTITEPDTSATPTPQQHTFIPPATGTLTARLWGGGGGVGYYESNSGGGGGFAQGDIAVTAGDTFHIGAADTSNWGGEPGPLLKGGAGGGSPNGRGHGGGGLSYISTVASPQWSISAPVDTPNIYMIAGGGGGGGNTETSGSPGNPGGEYPSGPGGTPNNEGGGGGGGLTGTAGGPMPSAPRTQTANNGPAGGGGSQTQGGDGGGESAIYNGSFLRGGDGKVQGDQNNGGGGNGYYGGGAGSPSPGALRSGGGGSSYIGNPNVSSASTTQATGFEGAGVSDPTYAPINYTNAPRPAEQTAIDMNDGAFASSVGPVDNAANPGGGGYVLISGSLGTGSNNATIISSTFTASSEPSTARIVVFQENVDTPTLNTDIIASVTRDGTNFSNATLTDSGYVTGSSGQRILSGTVDVSGQPTGTSMRWKLTLANNEVKIHGVSLQWG